MHGKLRLEMKETKVSPKILLVKSSENNFIFLAVFNLIICVTKASKNFRKIAMMIENIRADFFGSCQNSLRQTSPQMMHI